MTGLRQPTIIQGGMGAGVSGWRLASAVSRTGQLGVVSGTALDAILARRLQLGDSSAEIRRALGSFPFPAMAKRIVDRHWIHGGKATDAPFRRLRMLTPSPSREQLELLVVANFVEVFLAKEGHEGSVGINYLEKIQLPTLPSLFGALLAGVDYVLMGAGIPTAIPGMLDGLCAGRAIDLPLRVDGALDGETFRMRFDPHDLGFGRISHLSRPKFLPIVASATLAGMLVRKSTGSVDGFVVEGPTAGGHNAAPRGRTQFNSRGEPVYGERDALDLEAMRSLGRPFWLAGSYGSPQQVARALEVGAAGVQVGTAFAFCEESGLQSGFKRETIRISRNAGLDVFTDPRASPTGFPFKVLSVDGSLSDAQAYRARHRDCDLGFLRQAYRRPDGGLGWRCPAEPADHFLRKGGREEETPLRKCLCNALLANIGLAQVRGREGMEKPLFTCGDDVNGLHHFLPNPEATSYSARDVVRYLMSGLASDAPAVTNMNRSDNCRRV